MQVNRWDARQAWTWSTVGWRLFAHNASLWLAMALIYLILNLLLDLIPFIGYLVLVLITPLLVSGALALSQALAAAGAGAPQRGVGFNLGTRPKTAADWKERLQALGGDAFKALFQTFSDPGKTLAVMVIATLALGMVVVIQVLAQLLKVGGSGMPAAGGVGVSVWLPALLGLLLVWLLKIVLIFVALYAVYLVALRDEAPLPAIEYACQACVRNVAPLAVLAAILILPMMVAGYLHALAYFLLGLLVLPLLINSVYASAKDIYG